MKELYSGPEVAALLGYTRAHIWRLTRAGVIDAVKGPGGVWMYTRPVVDALLKKGLPNARKNQRRTK